MNEWAAVVCGTVEVAPRNGPRNSGSALRVERTHDLTWACCCYPPCRAFSLAQAALQVAVGWACAPDLPFCFLLQTMVLVAFNKARPAAFHCLALLS